MSFSRFGRLALPGFCALVFAFLMLPILAVIPLSLNPGSFLVFPEEALSLRWYRTLGESPQWTRAFANSFKIATATTLIAPPPGTIAAIALATMLSRATPIIVTLITAPLITPVVVAPATFYSLFVPRVLLHNPVQPRASP